MKRGISKKDKLNFGYNSDSRSLASNYLSRLTYKPAESTLNNCFYRRPKKKQKNLATELGLGN